MNALQQLIDMLNGGEEAPKLTVSQMIEDSSGGSIQVFMNPLVWVISYNGALYLFQRRKESSHIDAIQTVLASLHSEEVPNTLKPITPENTKGCASLEQIQDMFPLEAYGEIEKEGVEQVIAMFNQPKH